jgi:hypothetical protein
MFFEKTVYSYSRRKIARLYVSIWMSIVIFAKKFVTTTQAT